MTIYRRWMLTLGAACWIGTLAAGTAGAGCTTDADCDDHVPCTHNECSAQGRCRTPVPLDVPESPCLVGVPPSTCETDVCIGQAVCNRVPKCDDGNACTDDLCDANGTCSYSARADGESCATDACGSPGTCHGGICEGATCEDHNPCTDDACGANGCTHTDKPSGYACDSNQNDCTVFRCNGRGECVAKAAAQNATCLSSWNLCSPWGTCTGDAQNPGCQPLPSPCHAGQPCATDGVDCSSMSVCGLVSTCDGGRCVDQTCDAGTPTEPCGGHCGSAPVNGVCMLGP